MTNTNMIVNKIITLIKIYIKNKEEEEAFN